MIDDLFAILKIILIDIVLSGDNAVVIAMAAHKLPEHQRKQAILWGGGIAIFLRIVFTMVMAFILNVPIVRLAGGVVLVFIACKLLLDEEDEHVISADDADRSAMAAIRMIFLADFVMSLDNMLAVAGASHGSPIKLLVGLFVSIVIIMTCSSFIARLMNRYHWIVLLGAGILALTAGEMMLGDRELASYVIRNHQISLSHDWEEWMLTRKKIKAFDKADELPPDFQDVVSYDGKELTFIGRMTEEQRDVLLARVQDKEDKETVEEMYEGSRLREGAWFQRKLPAKEWFAVQNHKYYFVSWIFYAIVITFCLTAPKWWRRKHEPQLASAPPVESPP